MCLQRTWNDSLRCKQVLLKYTSSFENKLIIVTKKGKLDFKVFRYTTAMPMRDIREASRNYWCNPHNSLSQIEEIRSSHTFVHRSTTLSTISWIRRSIQRFCRPTHGFVDHFTALSPIHGFVDGLADWSIDQRVLSIDSRVFQAIHGVGHRCMVVSWFTFFFF